MMDRVVGFYHDHCVYLPAMAGWFLFSALLSSYNKMVFGSNHLAFPCPLLVTSMHFAVQWIFSLSLSAAFPKYFGGDGVREMSWTSFLSTSIPCGLVTSGDVGLSNMSLVRISITFYTMVKASTPIFVLAWAYLLGIERITSSLIMVVFVIAVGEFLTVAGEVHFNVVGFCMCLSASVLSGARWTLVQLKLKTLQPPLKTTIATMRVLSPSMFFSLIFVSLIVERPWITLREGYFDTFGGGLHTLGMGLIGATFAIAMILCEFYLIMRANAIILMLGGVIKEMITIIVGVNFFGDSLNRINVAGCLIVFSGVVLFKVTHHLAKNDKGEEYRPVDELQNDDEEASELWMTNVPVKFLQKANILAFERESLGIQMEFMDERQEEGDDSDFPSTHHRIS